MIQALIILLSSFAGTLGFAMLLHAPRRAWLPASLVGGVAYLVYWLLLLAGATDPTANFAAALLGSLAAQGCARRMRMIATVFITLSIVPLVPGLGLYRCMALLGEHQNAAGLQAGVGAMTSILMIALGIGMGSFLFRLVFARAERPLARRRR